MVGPSKILTVSYGTFSCTLEGFDDPFSTMKSIAEYFRDLAADDRYFGAEPPQPDPAMLHRIAEREVHRRVEARVQDNGVILRAEGAPAGAAAPPSYAPAYVSAGAASPLSDSVAAKLQRLRHAASATPSLMTVPDEAEILPEPAAPVVVAESPAPAVAAEAPVAMPVAAAVPELEPDAPDQTPVAAAIDDALPVAVALADTALADAPMPDTPVFEDEPVAEQADVWQDDDASDPAVAVVASVDADADEAVADETTAEAEPEVDADRVMAEAVEDWGHDDDDARPAATPTVDAAPLDADDDAALMESLAAALAGPADDTAPDVMPDAAATDDAMLATLIDDLDEVDAAAATADAQADDDAFEAALLAATAPELDAPDLEATTFETLVEDEPAADLVEAALAAEPAFDSTDAEAAAEGPADVPAMPPEDTAIEAAPVDAPAIEAAAATPPSVADENTAEVTASPVSAAKLQRARARVIKIRRAEPAAPVSTLAPDAEADLARELDALRSEAPVRPQLPEVTAETSVQRLIDQTNSQLDGAENRRRHAAIAHLKAAVAATVADRHVTGGAEDPAEENRLNAYRSDLERVVRPRRPVTDGAPREVTAVPTPLRPAPLVLVSAQRIDRPVTQVPTSPVRPRRIGGGALALSPEAQVDADEDDADEDENLFSPARGFAEFADRLGAEGLPDLLEAAVAYAACVEGRPHVSRPYMLRQVGALVADAEGQRDEMLKGFGRLLRGGRIEKVRAGMYALPGSSRMMAEAKKIAV